MNLCISWLLQTDATKRPSIEQVCLRMAANRIRKSLELGNNVRAPSSTGDFTNNEV